MNEFDPQPAEIIPVTPAGPPSAPKKESLFTRKLFLGQSLPWLAGGALALCVAAWYLFWPTSSAPDAGQLAFGQEPGLAVVPPAPSTTTAQPAQAPLQTGGLSAPATTLSVTEPVSSVPDDVVKLIREGREYESANREAISRLSDTVRAQTKALAALQQQLTSVAQENTRLGNQLTALAARPYPDAGSHATGKRAARPALAGMRLESVQEGMAWVSWQGRTWAVQAGDSLGGITVRDINALERSVTTSAGVLR